MQHDERWVTFDCYGTLLDWQTAFRRVLEPVADVVPARDLGLRRVWVDRERSGHDASIVTAHIHDMASLPAAVASL